MSEENIIPCDGRAIDINSSTGKAITATWNPDVNFSPLEETFYNEAYVKNRIDELTEENKRLKCNLEQTTKEYNYYNKSCVEANTKVIELARQVESLTNALKVIKEILNNKCGIISNAEAIGIINEVLDD